MRVLPAIVFYSVIVLSANAQSDRDFSGIWRLNPSQSDIRDFSSPPARMLSLEQTAVTLTVSASMEPGVPSTTLICPLDGKAKKSKVNDSTWNVVAKWEGTALLLNIIVTGPADYSLL